MDRDELSAVYYMEETCHVCGAECGSRLCDDCREETEWQFRQLMGGFTKEQVRHLANQMDGVYLEDYLRQDDGR